MPLLSTSKNPDCALALTRAYDLTGNGKYLAQAQAIYADIMTAWDTNCCGLRKGGLWWDKAHTQKATAGPGRYYRVLAVP